MSLTPIYKKIHIIIALDFFKKSQAMNLIKKLDPNIYSLKIGNIMFTLFGISFVKKLQKLGFNIFLDLKFHDIPNTIFGAIKTISELGIWMTSIHISGGEQMLKAAQLATKFSKKNKLLLMGVTILTSLNNNDIRQFGHTKTISNYVENLAKIAKRCDLDGIICSGKEVLNIKKKIGNHFKILTPGIRLNTIEQHDQKRILTPQLAKQYKVDYIIIGRIVTSSKNPLNILQFIQSQI